MKRRTEAEIEEALLRHQALGLTIGIMMVMIIVWLTLPNPKEQITNKYCFQQCKEWINDKHGELNIFSGPSFYTEMKQCLRKCTKEHNERRD